MNDVCDFECNFQSCNFDAGSCDYCPPVCKTPMLSNLTADPQCNLAGCDYDSGQFCPKACTQELLDN